MNATLNFEKLTVDSVKDLNQSDTAYIVDFRATGESLTKNIHGMFIYENLSQWLCSVDEDSPQGTYLVNADDLQRQDMQGTTIVKCAPGLEASTSVIDRVPSMPETVTKLWTGIPHPAIDTYAAENNLSVNYTYEDFLSYNDKLKQKKALKGLTPEYFEIKDEIEEYQKSFS